MSDAVRLALALCCILAWLVLVGLTVWRHRRARGGGAGPDAVMIAYASQTGSAVALAQATADALIASGRDATVRSFARLMPQDLAGMREVLFIAATTGEGDAPDDAAGFLRQWAHQPGALTGLRYALLALGDSHYRHFCAFGHRLDQLLHDAGATPVADRIDVDQGDTGALRHWQQNLRLFGAAPALPDWEAPHYGRWTLAARVLLNAGSPGEPMYRLRLEPVDMPPQWAAGDVAEVYPGPADDAFAEPPALPHRDYSLATIAQEGAIELVVRLFRDEQGRTGLGSGWLCEGAAIGAGIALRIRANPRFHTPPPETPLVLIGNGSGIAGLRAHLHARPAATRNWLIYGERDPQHDRPFADELDGWAASGHARIDRVFSRGDGPGPRYVQHVVAAEAEALRAWGEQGAAIFLCGSIAMGNDVETALREALGDEQLDMLLAQGRYYRDIY